MKAWFYKPSGDRSGRYGKTVPCQVLVIRKNTAQVAYQVDGRTKKRFIKLKRLDVRDA